eukprot:6192258-Pleurochrysis_carterae.AAC.1
MQLYFLILVIPSSSSELSYHSNDARFDWRLFEGFVKTLSALTAYQDAVARSKVMASKLAEANAAGEVRCCCMPLWSAMQSGFCRCLLASTPDPGPTLAAWVASCALNCAHAVSAESELGP